MLLHWVGAGFIGGSVCLLTAELQRRARNGWSLLGRVLLSAAIAVPIFLGMGVVLVVVPVLAAVVGILAAQVVTEPHQRLAGNSPGCV